VDLLVIGHPSVLSVSMLARSVTLQPFLRRGSATVHHAASQRPEKFVPCFEAWQRTARHANASAYWQVKPDRSMVSFAFGSAAVAATPAGADLSFTRHVPPAGRVR
jgi:hypothetical protein